MIIKPKLSDVPEYYHPYMDLVQSNDLLNELNTSEKETIQLMGKIQPEMENYSYSDGKWTINQVFRHIVDTERIFAYRALRFSRFDDTILAGFNENDYITTINSLKLNLKDLKSEYINIRQSSIQLFSFMNDEMLDFKGIANNNEITTRAIAYIIAGHNIHHCNIIKQRYLKLSE